MPLACTSEHVGVGLATFSKFPRTWMAAESPTHTSRGSTSERPTTQPGEIRKKYKNHLRECRISTVHTVQPWFHCASSGRRHDPQSSISANPYALPLQSKQDWSLKSQELHCPKPLLASRPVLPSTQTPQLQKKYGERFPNEAQDVNIHVTCSWHSAYSLVKALLPYWSSQNIWLTHSSRVKADLEYFLNLEITITH